MASRGRARCPALPAEHCGPAADRGRSRSPCPRGRRGTRGHVAEEDDDVAVSRRVEHVRPDEIPARISTTTTGTARSAGGPRQRRRGGDNRDHEKAQELGLHADPSRLLPARAFRGRAGCGLRGAHEGNLSGRAAAELGIRGRSRRTPAERAAMARMRFSRWLREHGWIVPGLYVLAAIALGVVLPQIDQRHTFGGIRVIETSAVEQLLGAIAAGMIAFTGSCSRSACSWRSSGTPPIRSGSCSGYGRRR